MLSANIKQQAEGLLDIVFNTFKEEISVYQTPTRTYINLAGNDANFNFNAPPEDDFTYVVASGVFEATVEYVDQQDNQQKNFPTPDMPIVAPLGFVKICVSGDAARTILTKSEKVRFDNTDFKIVSDSRPRGIFNRKYTDFWLQKIDQ